MTTGSQENTYRVYIDAMIPSYLVAPLSRDPKIAAWQRITREFWQDTRFEFVLSDYVIDEISIGDRSQAADRLQAVGGLTLVIVQDLELEFAEQLVVQRAIPENAFTDAIHVAVAPIHDTRYLATWNFTHLANASTRSKIEQVCRDAGYSPPRIDTPEAILEAINV